jgi:hypothetical protein
LISDVEKILAESLVYGKVWVGVHVILVLLLWQRNDLRSFMKKIFSGHFLPSEQDQKLLWEKCLFVLDANILLNLYRYSDSTRAEFIKILNSLRNRLWLPHRAEYLGSDQKLACSELFWLDSLNQNQSGKTNATFTKSLPARHTSASHSARE